MKKETFRRGHGGVAVAVTVVVPTTSGESVGAVLVPDVIPHELMKVRLLNVTHSAMCYAGILAGCTHVHEAVTHTKLRQFLDHLMANEIGPTLKTNPGMGGNEVLLNNIPMYSHEVLSRFENVAVKDQLDRIVGLISCVIFHSCLSSPTRARASRCSCPLSVIQSPPPYSPLVLARLKMK